MQQPVAPCYTHTMEFRPPHTQPFLSLDAMTDNTKGLTQGKCVETYSNHHTQQIFP